MALHFMSPERVLERELRRVIVVEGTRSGQTKQEVKELAVNLFKESISYARGMGVEMDVKQIRAILLGMYMPLYGWNAISRPDGVTKIDTLFSLNRDTVAHETFHIAQGQNGIDARRLTGGHRLLVEAGAIIFAAACEVASNPKEADPKSNRKQIADVIRERLELSEFAITDLDMENIGRLNGSPEQTARIEKLSNLLAFRMLDSQPFCGISLKELLEMTSSRAGIGNFTGGAVETGFIRVPGGVSDFFGKILTASPLLAPGLAGTDDLSVLVRR